ncbi:hypothetical protein [Hymenobacter convexus]|uniref:hypothetical protein n=1 Tax=Hymenobacter sp. CA1UV-4 TaxID=3063782 RepID=UPI002713BD38|nr:hypothetical protein [Hymenobacter sp. CA1UV-4]MDO7850850.1 hypothetical protein [Hymenobacter sp. CA1UV-4]
MHRAARRWGRGVALAACLLPAAHAQTVPAPPPAPIASPRPDSVKTPAPTFVADTARTVTVVTTEPSDAVTRRLAWRIGAAIVVLTLSTLLLYNVRSR